MLGHGARLLYCLLRPLLAVRPSAAQPRPSRPFRPWHPERLKTHRRIVKPAPLWLLDHVLRQRRRGYDEPVAYVSGFCNAQGILLADVKAVVKAVLEKDLGDCEGQ